MQEYLQELKAHPNLTDLIENFGIRDNFSIGFYGNGDEIWKSILEGFSQPPKVGPLELYWQEKYHFKKGQPAPTVRGRWEYDFHVYRCIDVGVTADINRIRDHYGKKELNGFPRADVCIVMHPYTLDQFAGEVTLWRLCMATAILDLGQFIIRKSFHAGFTMRETSTYHIP